MGSERGEELGFMPTGYRPSAPRSNPCRRTSACARPLPNFHSLGETVERKLAHASLLVTLSLIKRRINDPSRLASERTQRRQSRPRLHRGGLAARPARL